MGGVKFGLDIVTYKDVNLCSVLNFGGIGYTLRTCIKFE